MDDSKAKFMVKTKSIFHCQACGAEFPKWLGRCTQCNTWDSLVEELVVKSSANNPRAKGYAGQTQTKVVALQDVKISHEIKITTGISEFDRVLGGGLVQGSVVLIGGDPGIGKSTILLQALHHISQQQRTLYVTGEESLQQVSLRAHRLNLADTKLQLLSQTQVEPIIAQAQREQPQVMVIDSIQTMYTEHMQSVPGSVGQVRESAAQLVQFAKQTGIAILLVGHVTKEGTLAGPRVLEHMVDTVLYFEGKRDSRFRVIRAVKNRFGAVNELGLFAMTEKGLREVNHPSAIFLARTEQAVAGSSVLVTWEGSRPLLIEVQALVDDSHLANPRRVTVGIEGNRLAMLLAILHRHGGVSSLQQDVFLNVVGGMRVTETAADLAILASILSSLRNKALAQDLVLFGEVGLGGEVRPINCGQERLHEASKYGFKRAIVPKANMPKQGVIANLDIIPVQHIQEVIANLPLVTEH